MVTESIRARRAEPVSQFSVFTPNRIGRLHELVKLFHSNQVHVLALTVLDTSDSSIIRMVLDDPDKGRRLLEENDFAFIESELLVVELGAAQDLSALVAALLEAELNINYLYAFIPHPEGKTMVGFSLEDNELAENVLRRHMFRVLRQNDISR